MAQRLPNFFSILGLTIALHVSLARPERRPFHPSPLALGTLSPSPSSPSVPTLLLPLFSTPRHEDSAFLDKKCRFRGVGSSPLWHFPTVRGQKAPKPHQRGHISALRAWTTPLKRHFLSQISIFVVARTQISSNPRIADRHDPKEHARPSMHFLAQAIHGEAPFAPESVRLEALPPNDEPRNALSCPFRTRLPSALL